MTSVMAERNGQKQQQVYEPKPRNSKHYKISIQNAVVIALIGFLLGMICNNNKLRLLNADQHTELVIARKLEEMEEKSEGFDLTSVSYDSQFFSVFLS
jgi:hypothetical protein